MDRVTFQNARGASGVTASDPYFNNVSLLINGDLPLCSSDASPSALPVLNVGVTPSLVSPFSSSGGSLYFTADRLEVTPSTSDLDMGTGDFTVELWWKSNGAQTTFANVFASGTYGSSTRPSGAIELAIYTTNFAEVYLAGTVYLSSSVSVNDGTWKHIVIQRSGTTVALHVNGVRQQTATYSSSVIFANPSFIVGRYFNAASDNTITGWVSNLRIVKGTAVYGTGTTITSPTSPVTPIAGTVLLISGTRQAVATPQALDVSSYFTSLATTGNLIFAAGSPYGTSYPGSLYLNGSSYLSGTAASGSQTFGSSNFTMECWVKTNGTLSSYKNLFGAWGGTGTRSWQLFLTSMVPSYQLTIGGVTAGVLTGSITITSGTWNHVALVRNGSTVTLYVNGQVSRSDSISGTVDTPTVPLAIGTNLSDTGVQTLTGYLRDCRVVIGSAVYTAAFTPPSTPLLATSQTTFLMRFDTNAMMDWSNTPNVVTASGDADVEDKSVKFGGGAISFDGTGDYVTLTASTALTLGTGDFTIEFWVLMNNTNNNMYDQRSVANDTAPVIYYLSGLTFQNGTVSLSGGSLATGIWYHVAVTRSGTTTRLFVNGVQKASTTSDSTNYPNQQVRFGAEAFGAPTNYLNGYMDDVRVTKGVARYTANFTPPTKLTTS